MSSESKLETEFLKDYFAREALVASRIDLGQINRLIKELHSNVAGKRRVYVAGNGGSAATADHFVADLGVGAHVRNKERIVDAISLTSNSSVLTALGNDVSFDSIFSKQLQIHQPRAGDIVIAISASGNSPNIIKLLEISKSYNVLTCALTGFDGGIAKSISDISVHVPTEKWEYGIVEDIHLAICHVVAEALRR